MNGLKRMAWAFTNALQGYSVHSNRAKFHLIQQTFGSLFPTARSFADLGGVWKVNAAYTEYGLRNLPIDRAVLVDTDYPQGLKGRLSKWKQLQVIQGDFTSQSVLSQIGHVDVVFFFDVLLHQANPNWDDVLRAYSRISKCMIIYNQQWIRSAASVRLTDMPIEEYLNTVPNARAATYREYFARRNEIHPKFQKRYIDIHNMWQWGITDTDLRSTMARLGFAETSYANHGQLRHLKDFENHAFVFLSVTCNKT